MMKADIYSPGRASDRPLPLILAPHPITWTAEQDYHAGYEGFTRGYHRGYYSLADRYGVLIAMPHGHHRREESCSLASPEQITDMAFLIDHLGDFGYLVDPRRIYACGLSMGGQEALVAAGRFPEKFAAVCVFNPIVDLAAWQEDLANTDIPEIREFDTARRIADEVGGFPRENPAAYAERSATNYLDGLIRIPTFIFWSDRDLIVPRQITHHGYYLYKQLKEKDITCPIAEYNHTYSHGETEFNQHACWQLHEWCDYELGLHWLLCHQK
jgi:pimeloyl-ACP methyl ester carboxylesterase